jgi:uncharacterized protein (TIGR02246 family)
MNRLWFLFLSISLIGLTAGCQRTDTRESDEQAIRAADAEQLKAVQAKDVDRVVSIYADDASVFPMSQPIAGNKEAIRKYWANILAIPRININWQITKIEVSHAGDLAYVQGTFKSSFDDPKGTPVTEIGKWVMVWKKQRDGAWKAVAEISNADAQPQAKG